MVFSLLTITGLQAQTTISQFTWDANVTTAAVGPNGTTPSTSANVATPATSGNALSPGVKCGFCITGCRQDIDLTIPNPASSPDFNQSDIEYSIEYRRVAGGTCGASQTEIEGWWFTRGSDFKFGFKNGGKLAFKYRVSAPTSPFYTDIPASGQKECWNCATMASAPLIPVDGNFHEYTFRYYSSLGYAYILIDGVVSYIDSVATPGATFYSSNSSNPVIIGDGLDGHGHDTPILDNMRIGTPAPLPVDLKYFRGYRQGDAIELRWETASEAQNDFWTVLRSKDGKNWSEIGFLPGNGTDPDGEAYKYVDRNPQIGINYYWLKQRDLNGTEFAFKTIAIFYSFNGNNNFVVYPNPVVNPLEGLNIEFVSEFETSGIIQIFDQSGRIIKSENHELLAGTNRLNTELGNVPSGVYYIRMKVDGKVHSEKFMIMD